MTKPKDAPITPSSEDDLVSSGSSHHALRLALRLRGVENPCPKCLGMGRHRHLAGHGGTGGGTDFDHFRVCDACWGSGDPHKPGFDLRKVEEEVVRRTEEAMLAVFQYAYKCGGNEVAEALMKYANKRNTPLPAASLAQRIARVLTPKDHPLLLPKSPL